MLRIYMASAAFVLLFAVSCSSRATAPVPTPSPATTPVVTSITSSFGCCGDRHALWIPIDHPVVPGDTITVDGQPATVIEMRDDNTALVSLSPAQIRSLGLPSRDSSIASEPPGTFIWRGAFVIPVDHPVKPGEFVTVAGRPAEVLVVRAANEATVALDEVQMSSLGLSRP